MSVKIAFGGVRGKTSAANYLISKYPPGKIVSFSYPLINIKDFAFSTLNLPLCHDIEFIRKLRGWITEREPDRLINFFKLKCRRTFLYSKDEKGQNSSLYIKSPNLFCDDVITPQEIKVLKDDGWHLVYIADENPLSSNFSKVLSENRHYDEIIINDSSIEFFYSKLDSLFIKLFTKINES